jgi:flagella basal body P-ring formation protein FlgA
MIRLVAFLTVLLAAPVAGAHPEVERLARAALLRSIPFPAKDVRISRLRVARARLPRPPWTLRAEIGSHERFRGPTTFALVISGRGDPVRVWATADIRVRVETLVAARDLPRGRILGPRDVRLGRRELGERAEMALVDPGEALGRVLRRPLRAHEPITASDLEKPRVLEPGAAVLLVARWGGLTVTARGRALDGGALGDTVRAVNLASGRTVLGRVEDVRRVAVEF